MNFRKYILFILTALTIAGCSEYWDKHYLVQPETVNQNVWDAIQNDKDLSMYVNYIKEMKYDTLFNGNDSYTLFAPVNSAFTQSGLVTRSMIEYSIITHFVQLVNIKGKQKVQTLSEKFGMFERAGNEVTFDGVVIDFESPLYVNGKYFKLGTVITPKPSLYEFIAQDNPILKEYIDSKDSIILDKEKSRPLGFDEFGNTVYDTVSIVINNFEMKWFPVSEEFRNITGTIVFPKWEKYSSALDEMAINLGGQFKSYADIPKEWQNEILIPHLLTHGVFLNSLEVIEFLPKYAKDTVKLQNMLGDSVIINYLPTNRTLCSNGYFYDYSEYTIPDSLYSGKSRIEGESLVRQIGINKFAWRDSVKVKSTQAFEPVRELIANASNDSILKLNFPKGYNGIFTLDFNTMNLFPRKYLMVIRTHMDIGGKYNIYINNQLVKTFEYYDYVKFRGIITGVTGIRYVPEGRFNRFDCLVTLSAYGKAKIKIEYAGPNNVPGNGLVIDYIDFIPNK
jgi:uncharacterized surface protein with fasciclin (FAS1) repeats